MLTKQTFLRTNYYWKSDALIKETDIRIAKRPLGRIALMIGLEEFPAKLVGRPQLDRPRLRFRCMHMDIVGILRHQRGVAKCLTW